MKFIENPSSADGQTDRHEANSRFSQFCERAHEDLLVKDV